jgi:hypothetical protein
MSGKGVPPDDSIVAQAKSAMGDFFSSTIQALGTDMTARLNQKKNPSALSTATTAFTAQMIKLLGDRVKDVLPDSAGGNAKKPGGS